MFTQIGLKIGLLSNKSPKCKHKWKTISWQTTKDGLGVILTIEQECEKCGDHRFEII